MKNLDFTKLILITLAIAFSFLSLEDNKVIGQTNSLSSSGCPQIQTDCASEPPGCESTFGIYDPNSCMCICPASSSGNTNDNSCKCREGQFALMNMCSSIIHRNCLAEYNPVCGCDGITYGNSCVASFSGIKKKTKGICNTLNPKPIACLFNGDCPSGICPDGKVYEKFNCLSKECHELNFFSDPCLSAITPPLNKNFTGIWKGRVKRECVICIQIVPECSKGQILIPQTCTECANCKDATKARSSFHINNDFSDSKIVTLSLCVKEDKLEGELNQIGVFEEGKIISQNRIAKNKVEVTFKDKNDLTTTLTLNLILNRLLTITFEDGHSFDAIKVNSFRNCLRSPSI